MPKPSHWVEGILSACIEWEGWVRKCILRKTCAKLYAIRMVRCGDPFMGTAENITCAGKRLKVKILTKNVGSYYLILLEKGALESFQQD